MMATLTGHVLNIKDLNEVINLLKRLQYSGTSSYDLGLSLGLLSGTLDRIENDYKGDTNRRLLECLKEWLRQNDKVKDKGGPTLDTLAEALRSIGEIAVADGIMGRVIHDEVQLYCCFSQHPACMILAKHSFSIENVSPKLAPFLYQEGLIVEELLPANARMLLVHIQNAVCANHHNLMKFANILGKENIPKMNDIQKDYNEHCGDMSVMTAREEHLKATTSTRRISIPHSFMPEFANMREKFACMFFNINEVMNSCPSLVDIDDLKRYLRYGWPYLKPQLKNCNNFDDILDMISEKSSLTNIGLLESVVNNFNIEKAILIIRNYKESVREFCTTMPLRLFLNEKFSLPSPLQCETAIFVVHRSVDDCTLKDIDELVYIAFENMPVNVNVIREVNSFTITCSFPLSLSRLLIANALKNITLLKEKGVHQLTIGFCTISDIQVKEGASQTGSFSSSAVYSTSGMMDQLALSATEELIEKENEVMNLTKEVEELHRNEIKEIIEKKKSPKPEKKSDNTNKNPANNMLQNENENLKFASKGANQVPRGSINIHEFAPFKSTTGSTGVHQVKADKQMQVTKLELLQLFQYTMAFSESIDHPLIQELQGTCRSDEKASLFLKSINKDPLLLLELRYEKKKQKTNEKDEGSIEWSNHQIELFSPPRQCRQVLSNLTENHKTISIWSSTADIVFCLGKN